MSKPDVDLFVIGAGSGGTRAARIAAGHGAKVAVAEESRIGGTCVVRGCVPKKLYVYASRFRDDFADAAGFGWHVGETRFDWRTLVDAKEKEVTRLSGLYRMGLDKAGAEIIEERAIVAGPNEVKLASGRTITARHILVAAGGWPEKTPKIPGIEHTISSNEIFDLPTFPERLTIIGAGYIAVEFASAFARLGSQVTLVFRGDAILRGFDMDLRTELTAALVHAGISIRSGAAPSSIEKTSGGLRVNVSNGAPVETDVVLLATGRAPLTKHLGLETAGVKVNDKGAILVDPHSQTSAPSIYAVGDVTDRLNLTPVAIREGHLFADHVFGGKATTVDHTHVPTAVFTTPEIGTVGMSEEEACKIFAVVDIYAAKFRPMKATLSGRDEKTFMKIVVDGETDRVLGVHILGHDAGEMAQLLAISMKMGARKADFDATMALHPTAAEELVTMRTRTVRREHTLARAR